jgi:hypothetical protein
MYASKKMRQVIEAIATERGFDLSASHGYIKIDTVPNHDPLVISKAGPHLVHVYHYFLQNGDVMYDPEIVFYTNVLDGEGWIPVSITQSPMGVYRECTFFNESGEISAANLRLQREIADFANMWAGNIKAQGYIHAPVAA